MKYIKMRNGFLNFLALFFSFLVLSNDVFSQAIEKEQNGDILIKTKHALNKAANTAAVTNDTPCTAIALTNDNCRTGSTQSLDFFTTTGATTSTSGTGTVPSPGCWSSGFGETVWFKFTATSTSQKISTDVQLSGGGVNNDNQIAVYSSSNGACSGNFSLIGCQDDVCDCSGPGNNQQAEVTVTGLTAGTTYWIAVDGDGTSDGVFSICTQTSVTNDACQTAQAMTQGVVYSSSNVGASPYTNTSYNDINFTCGSTENMVFYTFTPTLTTTYYLEQSAQACSGSGTQVMIFKSAYTCSTLPANPTQAASSTYELVCSSASTAYRYFTMSLTAGQTYIIGVDGYAGDECTYNITIGQVLILPIEILSFEALSGENSVNLTWVTASEKENDFFTIERSHDGVNFESIATVKGAGNSAERIKYSFVDQDPIEGISYYRLMQTDFNKKEYHFNITSVEYSKKQELKFEIIPNPSEEHIPSKIQLSYVPLNEVHITIQDLNGIVLYEVRKKIGVNNIEIPNDFPKGVYIVKVQNDKNSLANRMIVK